MGEQGAGDTAKLDNWPLAPLHGSENARIYIFILVGYCLCFKYFGFFSCNFSAAEADGVSKPIVCLLTGELCGDDAPVVRCVALDVSSGEGPLPRRSSPVGVRRPLQDQQDGWRRPSSLERQRGPFPPASL